MVRSAKSAAVTATTAASSLRSAKSSSVVASTLGAGLNLWVNSAGDAILTTRWVRTSTGIAATRMPVTTVTPPPPPPPPDPDTTGVLLAMKANAGIVDITKAPYNAYGDGTHDDTAAINAALLANDYQNADTSHPHVSRAAARTVYFPGNADGTLRTYRVSGKLEFPGSSVRILGAGEAFVQIKLDNNAAGFGSTASPQYLLRTGQAGANDQENAGFSNFVHHLTLNTGSGNPGAIGCRYSVANAGSMRHVTIKSGDGNGLRGLMFGSTAGPGMVADITIDGFANGIWTQESLVNDIVGSGIDILNCATGIRHDEKSLALEDVSFTNCPLPVDITSADGALTLTNSSATITSGTQFIRMVAGAYVWLRHVDVDGYDRIVTQAGVSRFVGRTSLTEWSSAPYRRGNTQSSWGESSPTVMLDLPLKKAPEYLSTTTTEWARPQDFGYTSGDVGPSLQDAIDSGAKVIYLPYGSYSLSSPVVLRGAVRVFDGMCSILSRASGGYFAIADTDAGECIVQNLVPDGTLTFNHHSAGTVVIRDLGNGLSYTTAVVATPAATSVVVNGQSVSLAAATGDLFFESAGANQHPVISRPINVWLRQINRERAECDISGGATVRVLGDNIELSATDGAPQFTVSGSTVEIIGGSFDVLNYSGAYPTAGPAAYQFTNSTVSMTIPSSLRGSGTTVDHWLRDTSGGVVVGDISASEQFNATTGSTRRVAVPVYVSP